MDWRGTNPFIPSRSLPRSPPRSRLWKDQDENSDGEVEDDNREEEGSVISPEPSSHVEHYGDSIKLRKAPGIDMSEMKDSTFMSDDGAEERKDEFVDFRELRVFEKMEQLTERPSFCSQGSAVDRFMSHNLSFDEVRSEDEEEFSEKDDIVSSEISFEESDNDKENNHVLDNSEYVETVDSNVVIDKNCDREEKRSEVEYDAVLRDMYAAVRQNPPQERDQSSILCSTVLQRLNQQETVMNDMQQELQLAKELRKALECKEKELQSERLKFESYKLEETAKLEKQEKRVMMRSKSVEKINDETSKLRDLNSQQLAKINTLNKKMLRVETELRRKSNLWDSDRKKLMERIEVLEKLNKELQGSQFQGCRDDHSTNERSTSSTRLSQKRIQFSVDSSGSSTSGAKTTGNPTLNVKTINQKPRTSVIPAKSAMKKSSIKKLVDQKSMESSNAIEPSCEKPLDSSDTINFYDTAIVEQMQIKPGMPISTNLENELENDPKNNVRNNKSCVIVNNLGDTETVYTNGCRKYVSKSRNFSRVIYQNGDIKEKRPDGSILYFYSELGIRQYHYPNGLEMTSYPNGQMERKNPDGTHEILFPNGCVKFYRMDGREEFIFPDNTVYQLDPSNGNAVLCLPNGQKEIHSSNWKKRIYPDGTTKTVFGDGTLETEYPNGRIRRKDSSGNLVFDLLSSTPTLQSETHDAGKQLIQLHASK